MLRVAIVVLLAFTAQAWVTPSATGRAYALSAAATTWFAPSTTDEMVVSLEKQKAALLQLGAALDRGQSYNPTSGEYVSPSGACF